MVSKQIFISHSRRDKGIRNFILAGFSQVEGVRPRVMELEDLEPPPWRYIKREIENSLAVFLLIGENVIDAGIQTHNWISFEIGLACQMGKDVWVFEPINADIRFPVPYFDYFFLYDPNDDTHIRKTSEIIQKYANLQPNEHITLDTIATTCINDRCKMDLRIPIIHGKAIMRMPIICPACREHHT